MISVGMGGDQGSKADVCLYFWGRKPFIQAKVTPKRRSRVQYARAALGLGVLPGAAGLTGHSPCPGCHSTWIGAPETHFLVVGPHMKDSPLLKE